MEDENTRIGRTLSIIVIVVIIIAGSMYYMSRQKIVQNSVEDDAVACRLDTFKCSDGSYVARTGLQCEFAECPSTQFNNSSTSLTGKTTISVPSSPAPADLYK